MAGEQDEQVNVPHDDGPIDQVDSQAAAISAILEAIPGAWERTQEGLADARAGRVVPLDGR